MMKYQQNCQEERTISLRSTTVGSWKMQQDLFRWVSRTSCFRSFFVIPLLWPYCVNIRVTSVIWDRRRGDYRNFSAEVRWKFGRRDNTATKTSWRQGRAAKNEGWGQEGDGCQSEGRTEGNWKYLSQSWRLGGIRWHFRYLARAVFLLNFRARNLQRVQVSAFQNRFFAIWLVGCCHVIYDVLKLCILCCKTFKFTWFPCCCKVILAEVQ